MDVPHPPLGDGFVYLKTEAVVGQRYCVELTTTAISRGHGAVLGEDLVDVNGPGEMADSDYGYVVSGNKKVSLYKGKQIVRKDVSEDDALNELIDLIVRA